MKKLTQFLLTLLCISLPALVHAQDDDSKYLVGAVPEVDGKVIFTKEFSIPGMSQEEIYNRTLNWMQERLKKNENNSRVVYSDKETGTISGTGDEWIVFSSSALSLDRTKIIYQLTIICLPEKCILEVERIRYSYREGKEKYTAEEWITDKYALNKAQTKLVRGLAKWRRKTVDFVDDLCLGVAESLSASQTKAAVVTKKVEEKKVEKSVVNSGPMVITPKTTVTVQTPTTTTTTTKMVTVQTPEAKSPVTTITSVTAPVTAPATSVEAAGYKQVAPDQLPASVIQMGAGKLVIVIGNDAFNMTMMTANAGGSLGKISGKPVIFSLLSPDQAYEQMENAGTYTVRFYPSNQTEPSVVLECKRLPSQAPLEGQPRMYVGEILKAWTKN